MESDFCKEICYKSNDYYTINTSYTVISAFLVEFFGVFQPKYEDSLLNSSLSDILKMITIIFLSGIPLGAGFFFIGGFTFRKSTVNHKDNNALKRLILSWLFSVFLIWAFYTTLLLSTLLVHDVYLVLFAGEEFRKVDRIEMLGFI